MNLKKSFLALIGAFALIAGLMAPAAFAQTYSDHGDVISSGNGTGNVEVTSGGELTGFVCIVNVDFSDAEVSTMEGDTSTATLSLCYVDTQLDRGAFTTFVHATDWTAAGTSDTIPASNLTVSTLYGPQSSQLAPPVGVIWGDFGSGQVSPVLFSQTPGSAAWTAGDLSTPQQVSHGDEGRGTGSTLHSMELELTVPGNIDPGTYTSTITVDVLDGATP